MTDKKLLIKELILKNPNLSSTKIYTKIKGTPLGIRKTDCLKIYRETKSLPEPNIAKREASIPVKYRTVSQKRKIAIRQKAKPKPKVKRIPKVKPVKIPYEQTKFGKMAKTTQNKHKISEKNAIRRTRKLLKIPRKDYHRLNQIDRDILIQYGY